MKTIFKFILIASIVLSACTKTKKDVVTLGTKPPATDVTKTDVIQNQKSAQNESNDSKAEIKITKVESPRLPAIIKAENTSVLSFQSSGIITQINVKAGDFVKNNEQLAALDATIANLDLQNAKIDLEAKKIILEQAQKKYTSYSTLFKSGSLSRTAFEEEENNFKIAKLNLESAEINLKSKEYASKLTHLMAPFEGIISKSYKSLGDFVTPGVSVFDIVQTTDISVYAQVPVAFFSKIKTGMIFSFMNPLNGDTGKTTIQKVVPVIDPQSHTFDIYGKITEQVKNFVPGMYIEIIL